MTRDEADDIILSKSIPEPNTGCWLWLLGGQPSRGNYNYGSWMLPGMKPMLAHRAAYTLVNGSIPEGLKVLHKCDLPGCVNPDHLFLGTMADNMRDMRNKGRGRTSPSPGTKNGRAKLTIDAVRSIRADPRSSRELANIHGVGPTVIKYIKNGKLWASVR